MIKLIASLIVCLMISGCATKVVPTLHPELDIPPVPEVPKFTRDVLTCRNDGPDSLRLCRTIVEREVILRDHIETLHLLIKRHNEVLRTQK